MTRLLLAFVALALGAAFLLAGSAAAEPPSLAPNLAAISTALAGIHVHAPAGYTAATATPAPTATATPAPRPPRTPRPRPTPSPVPPPPPTPTPEIVTHTIVITLPVPAPGGVTDTVVTQPLPTAAPVAPPAQDCWLCTHSGGSGGGGVAFAPVTGP